MSAPLRREPARGEVEAALYPPLAEDEASRRRFLKLLALSGAASALGLHLTSCTSGGDDDGGGGGGGDGDRWGWLPWENDYDDDVRLAGAPLPDRRPGPVAVVIAGGPIDVVFEGGGRARLVVAAVVEVDAGSASVPWSEFSAHAEEHAAIVRRAAASVVAGALGHAQSQDELEAAIARDLNAALGRPIVLEVSIAHAKEPAREQQGAARQAPSGRAQAPAAPAAAAAEAQAASASAAARGDPPRAREIWAPCRRPGCTTCGSAGTGGR